MVILVRETLEFLCLLNDLPMLLVLRANLLTSSFQRAHIVLTALLFFVFLNIQQLVALSCLP